jgi:hypothetical protein
VILVASSLKFHWRTLNWEKLLSDLKPSVVSSTVFEKATRGDSSEILLARGD